MTSPKPPSRRGQPERILAGLRKLCEEQEPGRVYTTVEIAKHCSCTPENIGQIEKKALERTRFKLRGIFREHGLEVPEPANKRRAA